MPRWHLISVSFEDGGRGRMSRCRPLGGLRSQNLRVSISQEPKTKILCYLHVEHWRAGTLAAQLGLHQGAVVGILSQAGRAHRDAPIDAYRGFIAEMHAMTYRVPLLGMSRVVSEDSVRGNLATIDEDEG